MRRHGELVVTFPAHHRQRRWPRSDGLLCADDTAMPPTRYCAPPTPTVTEEPHGTPFPTSGGAPPGRTGEPPYGTSETRSATTHQRRISQTSRSPSCVP